MNWLLETLLWTGALIAAVLLARRAVARHFGPKAAYALWLLPLLRLALPPIVLPAWLAPDAVAPGGVSDTVAVMALPAAPVTAAPPVASFDWTGPIVALWLGGALLYIALRLGSYYRLRRELLTDARSVGQAGRVRLLETPATRSPLAFGVIDKVVALPPGFMASTDRRARDLALAHELSHHRAHDLAVNFLALPLFALHWFNPLSLLGWRAMRRDQEAACDARVVEHRDRLDRAAYALLIASAVAGPRGALAAPMACPVLGDKSIVHRLRNLTMNTPSHRRRRMGALFVGVSMLLVPFTASISYAQDESIETPAPPPPPLAPIAPRAPDAPLAAVEPTPPLTSDAPDAPHGTRTFVFHDEPGDGEGKRRVVVIEGDRLEVEDHALTPGGDFRVVHVRPDGKLSEKELRELGSIEVRFRRTGEELGRNLVLPREDLARLAADTRRFTRVIATAPRAPFVVMNCDGHGDVSDTTSADGKRVIKVCQQRISGHAVGSLRAARAQIAAQREMSETTRQEVLDRLDAEIERLEAAK